MDIYIYMYIYMYIYISIYIYRDQTEFMRMNVYHGPAMGTVIRDPGSSTSSALERS